MPKPNQLPRLNFEEAGPVFQQWLYQLADTVNTLAGHNGDIVLASHLDLGGNRIKNLAEPVDPTDALQNLSAKQSYSASVLKSSFEAGGATPFTTYRQINNRTQREKLSSYMNDLMSAPPSANNLFPTLTNGSGNVTVSIPAGQFMFADGSFINTLARTDVLSDPAQFAISAISSSGNVVSVTCAASGLVAGQVATINGVSPSSFNGTYVLTSSSGGGTNLTYQSSLGTVTGSGGNVQVNGIWYYALQKRLSGLTLLGPFSGDTLQNRLQANFDGFSIVAVVTITNSGGQIALSGGGGSAIVGSPTAGSFF